jgi:Tol biopolymer transport system component
MEERAAKNITADNPASDSTPLYSPDGKYIAYRAQQRPGYESDRFRLMLYDRKTGEKKTHKRSMRWVGTFAWSRDSKRIYFVHESEGEAPVESFSIDRPYDGSITVDGDPKETARTNFAWSCFDGYNDDLAITPDGKTLVFSRMSISFPTTLQDRLRKNHSRTRSLTQVIASPTQRRRPLPSRHVSA